MIKIFVIEDELMYAKRISVRAKFTWTCFSGILLLRDELRRFGRVQTFRI
jgi:hypothetical protein